MKRYTKPVNIRFEQVIETSIDKILELDSKCIQQNWCRSDLTRHFTREGIKRWEQQMRSKGVNV